MLRIIQGDALTELKKLDDESVQCCISSPPYWGLRDYGTATWDGGDPTCDHGQQNIRIRRNLAQAANACDGGNRQNGDRKDNGALGIHSLVLEPPAWSRLSLAERLSGSS